MNRGNLWYRLNRWAAEHIAFRAIGGMRVEGREHVPWDGPLIVAPVHFSNLDPPLVACAVVREISFMAKSELFRVPILGPWIRSLRAFPLDRGGQDMAALRRAISILDEGKALLVFPEGTRGNGTQLGTLTSGVAVMAKKTKARVLPVGICGTHRLLPRGAKWPKRGRVQVVIGQPFTYEDITAGLSDREGRSAFTQELERRLLDATRRAGCDLKNGGSMSDRASEPHHEPATEPGRPDEAEHPTHP